MTKRAKELFSMVVGIGLFVFCLVAFASDHGTRWRVGPLGMPETVPGSPTDPINAMIDASEHQQQIVWGGVFVLAACILVLCRKMRQALRLEAEVAAMRREVE